MPKTRTVDRSLAWFHRWAGIAVALFFLLCFASGAVLLFVLLAAGLTFILTSVIVGYQRLHRTLDRP